jgi:TonB family protein
MFAVLPASMRSEPGHPFAPFIASLVHAALVMLGVIVTRQVVSRDPMTAPIDPLPLFVTSQPVAPPIQTATTIAASGVHPSLPVLVPLSSPAMVAVDLPTVDIGQQRGIPGTPADLAGLIRGIQHDGSPQAGMLSAYAAAEVDEPVQLVRPVTPTYPPAMRAIGRTGVVRLQYVVDTLGGVEPRSIRVVESSDTEFIESATRAVMSMQFRAARAHGRVVRQLVEQVIRFAIDR